MLAAFEDYVKKNNLFSHGDKLLLALSGGEDSVCLFHLLLRNNYQFAIAHCNFQLRGTESDGDETFVRALAEKHAIPVHIRRFNTTLEMERSGKGVQETARNLRYHWFKELMDAHNLDKLLTAHHLGDNSETILINLLRSTGVSGLHGILNHQRTVRPLMFADREQISTFVQENALAFRLDKSNLSDNYLRNRIRHHILPVMKEAEPDIDRILHAVSSQVLEFENLAQELMDREWNRITQVQEQKTEIFFEGLSELQYFPSLLYYKLRPFGFNKSQVLAIADLKPAIAGKKIESGEWVFTRERDRFILQKKASGRVEDFLLEWRPEPVETGGYLIECLEKTDQMVYPQKGKLMLDVSAGIFPLRLRTWQNGDRIRPFGMNGYKKISDILTDKKADHHTRKERLVLVDQQGDILALLPDLINDQYKITPATQKVLAIYPKTP